MGSHVHAILYGLFVPHTATATTFALRSLVTLVWLWLYPLSLEEKGTPFVVGGHEANGYDLKTEIEQTIRKVEAGADLVITQGCCSAEAYHRYIMALRQVRKD